MKVKKYNWLLNDGYRWFQKYSWFLNVSNEIRNTLDLLIMNVDGLINALNFLDVM